ncbi:MAG: glycosyl hydrolase [Thermoanaerobaculia bacterium]
MTLHRPLVLSLFALSLLPAAASAARAKVDEKKPEPLLASATVGGLSLRSVGPALTSGRIVDLVVDPNRDSVWWLATASGGVWKTENAGTSWQPLFDGEGSFSIGTLAMDPKNPNVVWVGTGENNNQRSVAYGDGLYRTLDGGKSWKKMGLDKSEHIARIVVDPRDSSTVWVAAQGPLWSAGGERGVYRSTDDGATWSRSLHVSDDTGATDLVMDPRDPDTLIAAMHQRRRHVWTYVSGGPESALYKTTDGGANWRKLDKGLPAGDIGRIGLAISPIEPDIVYAVVEAEEKQSGFYRSTDRGESWEKRSPHTTSGNYYVELVADPHQLDRVYSMDTFLKVSDDGGTTFRSLGERNKHVDNHVLWSDPRDRSHYLVGCDGGLYESFDRGATWRFFENLPITQYYRVGVDDSQPFYNICGGTQDNFSMCGPSGTDRLQGPANEDWFVTQGGDGFWTVSDPTDPAIVYAEAQYGVLTRYDRRSGENLDIQPQQGADEPPLRWNWDAPLVLSPHSPTRLYFAANRLFKSDDRGQSWRAISPDLSRQIDRNKLEVFGRVQRPEAVARGASTSLYGSIVALAESPLRAGLLYAGTDDGLIQVSENDGGSWRRSERFPGVPDRAYVRRLVASGHDENVVFAVFDNHKMGDFRPFVLRSGDRGQSWSSIAGDLPERGTVYSLLQDPVDRDLLFAGTEFGLHFSVDGGKKWIALKGGLPTIQVRDLAFQARENDLVLGTFGRGFYVLDDVSPLRAIDEAALGSEALLFEVPTARIFVPGSRIGGRANGFLGESYFQGANDPYGATFTWYLKDEVKTKKETRLAAEKEAIEAKRQIEFPSFEDLRAETHQQDPKLVIRIRDEEGNAVRRLETKPEKGIHRLTWNLRYDAPDPVSRDSRELLPWESAPIGPLVAPGTYQAQFDLVTDGEVKTLGTRSFEVVPLGNATLAAADRGAVLDFQKETARLLRATLGAERFADDLDGRLELLQLAADAAPSLPLEVRQRLHRARLDLEAIRIQLSGDSFLRSRNESTPPSISERVQSVSGSSWVSTSEPTATQREACRIAGDALAVELGKLERLATGELPALEKELELAGAPWTPGRLPRWPPVR